MWQLVRPQLRIALPTVELLLKDPLPILVDEICGVLEKTNVFNTVEYGECTLTLHKLSRFVWLGALKIGRFEDFHPLGAAFYATWGCTIITEFL